MSTGTGAAATRARVGATTRMTHHVHEPARIAGRGHDSADRARDSRRSAAGWVIGRVLYGGYFGNAIVVAPEHDVLGAHGAGIPRRPRHDGARAVTTLPFWLALAGIATAVLSLPHAAGPARR